MYTSLCVSEDLICKTLYQCKGTWLQHRNASPQMKIQNMNSTLPHVKTQTTLGIKNIYSTSCCAGNGGEQLTTKYVYIIKRIIPNKNLIDVQGDTGLDWLKYLTSDLTYSRSIPIITPSRPYPSGPWGQNNYLRPFRFTTLLE